MISDSVGFHFYESVLRVETSSVFDPNKKLRASSTQNAPEPDSLFRSQIERKNSYYSLREDLKPHLAIPFVSVPGLEMAL